MLPCFFIIEINQFQLVDASGSAGLQSIASYFLLHLSKWVSDSLYYPVCIAASLLTFDAEKVGFRTSINNLEGK